MTPLVPLMMWGWIPAVLTLFCLLPPKRAVAYAFIFAWMFMPVTGYPVKYLPDYDKITATCYGVLFSMLVLDSSGALFKLRPHWLDLAILVWCFVPAASSLDNGLGIYDAGSSTLAHLVIWGIPYLAGRVYCNDGQGMRELTRAMIVGALVYLPLCLYEMKFAPLLHQMVYGFRAVQDFAQNKRMGGWRPTVFMHHGLMLSVFLGSASLCAMWLWTTGNIKRMATVPMSAIAGVLTVVTLLCRSTGASGLMLLMMLALAVSKYAKTSWLLVALAAAPPAYCAVRLFTPWEGEVVVPMLATIFGEGRAGSLQFRIDNELDLSRHAMTQPVFGWAGWDRSAKIPGDLATTRRTQDSLWILAVGKHGLVGLTALLAMLLLPPVIIFRRLGRHIADVNWAPVVVIATITMGYMLDNLLNAMVNPIFMLGVGGLVGIVAAMRPRAVARSGAAATPQRAVGAVPAR